MNITTLISQPVPTIPRFDLSADAEQTRAELIATSGQFKLATTAAQANSLGEAARDIRSFVKSVRDIGLALRQPLNQATKRIKEIEDDYCGPLELEQKRLERVSLDWHQAEQRRVQEEERVRQVELQRLERERQAAEQLAREEADRIRLASEAAEREARAREAAITNEADLAKAVEQEAARKAEAARQQALADAAAEEARKASEASQAALRAPMPEARKIGGMPVKKTMKWEVTDIHALYKARPELVKLDPKPAAILSTCFPEQEVPGLKLWWEEVASTRKW